MCRDALNLVDSTWGWVEVGALPAVGGTPEVPLDPRQSAVARALVGVVRSLKFKADGLFAPILGYRLALSGAGDAKGKPQTKAERRRVHQLHLQAAEMLAARGKGKGAPLLRLVGDEATLMRFPLYQPTGAPEPEPPDDGGPSKPPPRGSGGTSLSRRNVPNGI